MPMQIKIVNGKKLWRYGDTGKWFPTKEQAEEQMRAMYAAGYQGKKESDKK
jgi:hypothetical protein